MNQYERTARAFWADVDNVDQDDPTFDIASDAVIDEMMRLGVADLPLEDDENSPACRRAEDERGTVQSLMEAGYVLALRNQADDAAAAATLAPPAPDAEQHEPPWVTRRAIESQRIAAHLGVDHDEDYGLGMIDTCVAVIASHEPGAQGRDADLVCEAFASILEWAGDYGVGVLARGGEVEIVVQP